MPEQGAVGVLLVRATTAPGKMSSGRRTEESVMASVDSFGSKGTLDVDGTSYEIYRLAAVTGDGIPDDAVGSLPFSLKVLLENLLRTEDGANITADDIRALAAWDPKAEP